MVEDKKFIESENAERQAASVKQLNEIKMKVTTVEALKAEGKEIVFLEFNRDVTENTPHVKELAKSIKEIGLLTPLHLVPAQIALKEGIGLLDKNGSKVTDGNNKLALTDGNNKFKAILMLRKSGDPGKAIEPIKCIIDEDAKDIQRMVMTMNNVVKTWSYADAVKSASVMRPNEVIDFIAERLAEGFPPSSISLLLTGKNSKFKKSTIMNYNAGTEELPNCNVEKAKKKLAGMKAAGFSKKIIRSRYLIEAIDELLKDEHKLDDVLAALNQLTPNEVKFAEDNKLEDLSLLQAKLAEVEGANNN